MQDDLFEENSHVDYHACLNYSYDQWHAYTRGYRVGGDLLIEHIKKNSFEIDGLVYPVVFMYRQCIELLLKKIIIDSNSILNNTNEFPMIHDVLELWTKCIGKVNDCLKGWEVDWNKADIKKAEKYLIQLSAKDTRSMAFRYPVDKKGTSHNPEIKRFNVVIFGEKISKVIDLLEKINFAISELPSWAEDSVQ